MLHDISSFTLPPCPPFKSQPPLSEVILCEDLGRDEAHA